MKAIRPKFERPPIVEQAISISFEPLAGFSVGHFGLFWHRIQGDLPDCNSQPIVQTVIEVEEPFVARQTQIQLLPSDALPRAFFSREDGSEIIQLQNDKVTYNWSAVAGDDYPSFEKTIARFRFFFGKLEEFIVESFGERVRILQCELTNVNIIPVADAGGSFALASTFLPELDGKNLDNDLCFEGSNHRSSYKLTNDEKFVGRLHSSMGPARRISDGEPVIRFELTAKGSPNASSVDEVVEFFEVARSAINAAFLRETTEAAKQFWGIK